MEGDYYTTLCGEIPIFTVIAMWIFPEAGVNKAI